VELRTIKLARDSTIVGIDVGEDYLDIATIRARAKALEFARVALTAIGRSPFEEIAESLKGAVGESGADAIALIDSPRYPRDVSGDSWTRTTPAPTGREIDAGLRAIVKDLGRPAPSMFPTPLASWFDACTSATDCKPHLSAIARALGATSGAPSQV